jgi:hypothetical protein
MEINYGIGRQTTVAFILYPNFVMLYNVLCYLKKWHNNLFIVLNNVAKLTISVKLNMK